MVQGSGVFVDAGDDDNVVFVVPEKHIGACSITEVNDMAPRLMLAPRLMIL